MVKVVVEKTTLPKCRQRMDKKDLRRAKRAGKNSLLYLRALEGAREKEV